MIVFFKKVLNHLVCAIHPEASQIFQESTKLYARIVEQSRLPTFYIDFQVEDSLRGRFEMMCLHLFLVLHRLKHASISEQPFASRLSQLLCDAAVEDFDHSLRALRVSESAVGRAYKQAVEGFYGRLTAYDKAFETDDPRVLHAALARNIYPQDGRAITEINPNILESLADYMNDAVALLANQHVHHLIFTPHYESNTHDEHHPRCA